MAQPSPVASQAQDLKLGAHKALVFDVYGTLVDWESAIHDAFAPVFSNLTRKEILLRYAEVEGTLQTQFQNTPYAALLERAYHQLTTPNDEQATAADEAQRFGQSIPDWKPFPDTIDALHRLKQHFALVVLSNVDDRSFAGTHARLCTPDYPGSAYPTITPDSPFSLILTAQQVGAYKPNPAMLESALRQLSAYPDPSLPCNPLVQVEASHVLVVANSIRHDIIPAIAHGLPSIWISRHGINTIGNEDNVAVSQEGATGGGDYPYQWRYETLGGLADAVEAETQV